MKKLLLLTPLLVLLIALPVQAALWQQGDSVSLTNPSTDDFYAAGGSVSLQAPVTGDVYAVGGNITVNQPVSQDVVVAGGTINLFGNVGDDARLAGGTIIINSPVADDLVVAGGSITINADIGGDLVVAGGQVIVNGKVGGAVKIAAGTVTLNGSYAGPSEIRGEEIVLNGSFAGPSRIIATKSLAVQTGSTFNAPIEYAQPSGTFDFAPFLKNNATATYQPTLIPQEKPAQWQAMAANAMGWFALVTLLSAMLVIGLIIGFGGQYVWQIADDMKKNFWSRFGAGIVYFIVLPVAAIILMVTIIGVPLGLLALATFILSLAFAKTLTATMIAAWLIQRANKQWTGWRLWLVAVGIYILLRIASYIPVIGWLATVLVVCATFGAMIKLKWTNFRQGAMKNS